MYYPLYEFGPALGGKIVQLFNNYSPKSAINCFSINFPVNIMSLGHKLSIVFICTLHRCLHHAVNMNFSRDKASFFIYKHVAS